MSTEWTAEKYAEVMGAEPREDELDRANCAKRGDIGHWQCGVCTEHGKPRFACGCLARTPEEAGR